MAPRAQVARQLAAVEVTARGDALGVGVVPITQIVVIWGRGAGAGGWLGAHHVPRRHGLLSVGVTKDLHGVRHGSGLRVGRVKLGLSALVNLVAGAQAGGQSCGGLVSAWEGVVAQLLPLPLGQGPVQGTAPLLPLLLRGTAVAQGKVHEGKVHTARRATYSALGHRGERVRNRPRPQLLSFQALLLLVLEEALLCIFQVVADKDLPRVEVLTGQFGTVDHLLALTAAAAGCGQRRDDLGALRQATAQRGVLTFVPGPSFASPGLAGCQIVAKVLQLLAHGLAQRPKLLGHDVLLPLLLLVLQGPRVQDAPVLRAGAGLAAGSDERGIGGEGQLHDVHIDFDEVEAVLQAGLHHRALVVQLAPVKVSAWVVAEV